jgi:hypothetical protein
VRSKKARLFAGFGVNFVFVFWSRHQKDCTCRG